MQGRVGHLDVDCEVDVGAGAVAELTSKVYGHGSVDHRRLETLMSRGIAPEEAVDIIVRGMLR